MRKVQLLCTLLTLGLAASFTALALLGVIYLNDYAHGFDGAAIGPLDWHDLALGGSAYWPGLVAMIVGQMIVLRLLLTVRRRSPIDSLNETTPPTRP